ncbi:MAG: DUF5615 family PIN-like protein [Pirellulales bacterium]
MAIRFHLDENVSNAIALALRRRGVDVSTAVDAELLGADDSEHLRFAKLEGRVVVTHDDDFTRIHADGFSHAGVCYCPKDKHPIGDLIRLLVLVHECFEEEEIQGHLEYL